MEDRRSVGASSCNSGDGTDQRVQSLMFMMMIHEFTNTHVLCMEDDIQIFVRFSLGRIPVSLVFWSSRITGVILFTACHLLRTKRSACTTNSLLNNDFICVVWGTAVTQWLRCRATNRKVADSIPVGVSGHKILPIPLWRWGRFSL